ncbi:26S proteasome regulatory subunit [Tulasnella sp. JGI-2019a]|nr:26S proteasome regulatory subunit [Tulasnella sp. JGI-2019a]KAG9012850.1 26S proteasome regulatory subunit [Tulasnella sp. JGI-2019a]
MASSKMNIDVDLYLSTVSSKSPAELHPFFAKFTKLHTRRLWHQLTLAIFEFLDHPLSPPYQVDLFNKFIHDFESKLNQLKLVEIGVKISRQLSDPNEILAFLSSLLSRIDKAAHPAAYVLALSSLAHAKLVFGDMVGTKTDVDACSTILDDLDGVEPNVNAAFYGVAADYYKAKAEYAPYYKNSLLYLACVNPETDITPEDRLVRAHDLGISALLGETIYNFGELLMHPILDSLDNTPHHWIKDLLFTFNEGNIGKFESLGTQLPREPILAANADFLRQKICLMALIEAVFKRSGDQRTMSFQTIAEETRLPQDEVEHLVMKALSLKLIRGTIDQVDQKAAIVWVQPRVLSRAQVGELADRLGDWCAKLAKVEQFIHSQQTPDLMVS